MSSSDSRERPRIPLGFALIGGKQLRSLLGFESGEAFRAAIRAGRVHVALMKIEGRKGWFARTADVSAWLASLDPKVQNASSQAVEAESGQSTTGPVK